MYISPHSNSRENVVRLVVCILGKTPGAAYNGKRKERGFPGGGHFSKRAEKA